MSALISYALQGIHEKDPREEIIEEIGPYLSHVREIGGADLLIAVYKRPRHIQHGTLKLELPDSKRDEDDVQGVSGLVLMMGPLCYKTEKTKHWFKEPPRVGDWVTFDIKASLLQIFGSKMCRYVNDQYIRGIINRPDIVA
jgi:hypothetical protein